LIGASIDPKQPRRRNSELPAYAATAVERYGHRFAQLTADLGCEHELGITPTGA
jgi:hypothetical protein